MYISGNMYVPIAQEAFGDGTKSSPLTRTGDGESIVTMVGEIDMTTGSCGGVHAEP
jgi:hypothetical protein